MDSEHIIEMRRIAETILEIPANEQCIGHLQVAIRDFMWHTFEEVAELNRKLERNYIK